jgi:ABC-2 type transport system ATP-binding protein
MTSTTGQGFAAGPGPTDGDEGGRLRVTNLGKQYGDVQAVEGVGFALGNGVHGLLGPNGAGKSTLMRMLTTVTDPSTGEVRWEGTRLRDDPDALRRVLGYLPQDFGVYPDLTLVEFLRYIAALRGVPRSDRADRIDEMARLTNLWDVRDRKLRTFSGGMQQRVGIAQALVNDPDLLIVDEPTVGLDPQERVRFRNVLAEVGRDRVVILSTHIVPDIEATATTVALLNDGELLVHTDPETLAGLVEGDVYECTVPRSDLESMREEYLVSQTVQRADGARVRLLAETPPTDDASVATPTLEDAYLACVEGDWELDGPNDA